MATIKSFTSLEQSKKLATILPLESADMYYSDVPVREWIDKTDISKGTHVVFKSKIFAIENLHNHEIGEGDIYAWSLAALLDIVKTYSIRLEIALRVDKNYNIFAVSGDFVFRSFDECSEGYDNLVDACVAMIEKLHELKML